jgi:hypothetical protein
MNIGGPELLILLVMLAVPVAVGLVVLATVRGTRR